MSGKKLIALGVVVVVALAAYRRSRGDRVDTPNTAFTTIANLTPATLARACGVPVRDTTGKLLDNDGVRDVEYQDASGRSLAVRFLFDERSATWSSIGVWTATPDDLGALIEDLEALRSLPCLEKAEPLAPALSTPSLQVAGWGPTEVPRDVPQVTITPPIPAPISPTNPGLTSGLKPNVGVPPIPSGIDSVAPTVPPTPSTSNGAGGDPGGNDNGPTPNDPEPPDPPPPPKSKARFIGVPCPAMTDTAADACSLISSELYLRDLDTLRRSLANSPNNTNDDNKNWLTKLDELTTKLTGRDFRVIQMPALLADRATVVKAIFRLEVDVINVVAIRMKTDVARLTPMPNDSPAVAEHKLEVARSTEKERRETWRAAVEESRPERSMSSSDDGSRMQKKDNFPFRQAGHINASGWGGN